MNKERFYPDISDQERLDLLKSNSESTEEQTYMIPLLSEEVNERRLRFADISINEARILDDFKAVREEIKAQLKVIKEEKTAILSEIKTKMLQETGEVYKLVDQEDKTVYFYNGKGYLVSSRPILPEERQTTMKLRSVSNS
jgi:hypothetical protein